MIKNSAHKLLVFKDPFLTRKKTNSISQCSTGAPKFWYINNIKLSNHWQIKDDNVVIPFADLVRNLEVILRSTLSWDKHVGKIYKNVNATLSNFNSNKKALSIEIKIKLTISDFLSF